MTDRNLTTRNWDMTTNPMIKTGVVDVGGGTRGIYGAGIFDYFLDHSIRFDYLAGVSAGSANGVSFLAGQRGRNYRFYDTYAFRKEYMSFRNLLRIGSYVDLDYIYGTLSNAGGEDPVDFEAFQANPARMEIVATDARTGKAVYFSKEDIRKDEYHFLKASSCVPVACRPYPIGSRCYYDGGISDPIPFRRALEAGCDKVVVILTRPKDTLRKPGKDPYFARLLKRRYPAAARALDRRAETYNRSLEEALALEREGKLLILAPDSIDGLKTLTQDHGKLEELYRKGMADAARVPAFLNP